MQWDKSYSKFYQIFQVDPYSWRDIERLELTSGTISKSTEDLLDSADIEMPERPGEIWVRIYMDARQEGENPERVALFTGLTSSPKRKVGSTRDTYSVECYSPLKAVGDVLLQRGWYAPVGIPGAEIVEKLLSIGKAPVEIATGSPGLKEYIIAEDGETYLSMASKIAKVIGWRIRLDGMGVIHVIPDSTTPTVRIDALSYDVVEPDVETEDDWYDAPNVFRAVSGETVAVARDDDADRRTSTVSRGREIWMEDEDADLNDSETLAEYAVRRLKEEQAAVMTRKYKRRFTPEILPGDRVEISYAKRGISGTHKIKSQKITLDASMSVDEEAEVESTERVY